MSKHMFNTRQIIFRYVKFISLHPVLTQTHTVIQMPEGRSLVSIGLFCYSGKSQCLTQYPNPFVTITTLIYYISGAFAKTTHTKPLLSVQTRLLLRFFSLGSFDFFL